VTLPYQSTGAVEIGSEVLRTIRLTDFESVWENRVSQSVLESSRDFIFRTGQFIHWTGAAHAIGGKPRPPRQSRQPPAEQYGIPTSMIAARTTIDRINCPAPPPPYSPHTYI